MRAPTGWSIVGWVAAAVVTMCAVIIGRHGLDQEGFRVLLRATARTSLGLFLAAFLASSLRRLWRTPQTAWLRRNRRQLGVGFAFSHAVHGWAIVSLVRLGADVDPVTLVVGGFAYLLIAAMTVTSFDRTTAWMTASLGPRAWRRLHATGIWYLWFVFTATYAGTAGTDPLAVASLGALAGALVVRMVARARFVSLGVD